MSPRKGKDLFDPAGPSPTPFQMFLIDKAAEIISKSNRRHLSDTDIAKIVGVHPANWNQWINGNRVPDIVNALKLANKFGNEVLDFFDYPRLIDPKASPKLIFVLDHWPDLQKDTQDEIYKAIKEEIGENNDADKNKHTTNKSPSPPADNAE